MEFGARSTTFAVETKLVFELRLIDEWPMMLPITPAITAIAIARLNEMLREPDRCLRSSCVTTG
jgi:hypothetical protein